MTDRVGVRFRHHHVMPTWDQLAAQQADVISHRQLRMCGVSPDFVKAQVAARRWARRTTEVITTTTGVLSSEQVQWLGVLHAGGASLLGGLSAAAQHGLRNWHRDVVTVLVDQESSFEPVSGVRFFRTRRSLAALRASREGVPCARLEPAILLFAGHERHRRTAHGAVMACVQQGLTTPERLMPWIADLRPLRRAGEFRDLLDDLTGGSHSVGEREVVMACRAWGLQPPIRQRQRHDRSGRRRYTDCEWDLPDGRVLVLEVDGAFHMDITSYTGDVRRHRSLTTGRRLVVRATSYELRHEPEEVMADLVALGVPRVSEP